MSVKWKNTKSFAETTSTNHFQLIKSLISCMHLSLAATANMCYAHCAWLKPFTLGVFNTLVLIMNVNLTACWLCCMTQLWCDQSSSWCQNICSLSLEIKGNLYKSSSITKQNISSIQNIVPVRNDNRWFNDKWEAFGGGGGGYIYKTSFTILLQIIL